MSIHSEVNSESISEALLTGKKPLLRGHFHQEGFFIAIGACAMLVAKGNDFRSTMALVIYSISLIGLLGISALYHRPYWNSKNRAVMKKLDHAAIFLLIAGTGTPVCLIGMNSPEGDRLLLLFWTAAVIGACQAIFWSKAPRFVSSAMYIIVGWMAVPYLPEMETSLGFVNAVLLLVGGVIYSLGALVYAFKYPNPSPKYFGYHEIFHIIVIIAAIFHFLVINSISSRLM